MTDALPYRIAAVFNLDSDWGSVVLITADALIDREPNFEYPPDVRFTGTQLFVGKQGAGLQTEKRMLPFNILSNNKPVDIATSHGDASSGSEPGNVSVGIASSGITLFNDDNTGDGVNVKVFPKVPLAPPGN